MLKWGREEGGGGKYVPCTIFAITAEAVKGLKMRRFIRPVMTTRVIVL